MYYIESRERIGGLLVEKVNELVSTLSFSIKTAISFQRRKDARKYLHDNNLQHYFRAIKINHKSQITNHKSLITNP